VAASAPDTATLAASRKLRYQVSNGKLYDPCGKEIVLRGVSRMFEYQDPTGVAMPEIAKSGANVVWIFWQTDRPATALEPLIKKAADNKLIAMIELHDATGNWSKMDVIKKWWAAASTVTVVKKYNSHLLLNIANEAGADPVPVGTFSTMYNGIIMGLRKAGISAPAVVDAARWGRDVSGLLDAATTILNADPMKNVIFSWHLYEGTQQDVDGAFARAAKLKVDLIVGEFGPVSPGACSNTVPWRTMIAAAQKSGIGWLAWSWDNLNSDCGSGGTSSFNLVSTSNGALSSLTSGWGAPLVRDDPNGIVKTSKRTSWQINGTCSA
jgi:mannan endo-1,4-beta-mannosidase